MYYPKYYNRSFRPNTSGKEFQRRPRLSFPLKIDPEHSLPAKYRKKFIVDDTDEIVQEEAKENFTERNKHEEG